MADAARSDTQISAQRFQLLINAVTDYAIYMLDAEGHVATWNPGARQFKGYEEQEIIGRHFSNFFTPEDRASGLPQRALRTAAERAPASASARSTASPPSPAVSPKSTPLRTKAPRSLLPCSEKALSTGNDGSAAPAIRSGLTVLLVEDNDHVRGFAAALLEELGYAVRAVAEGDSALQELERERPDILFTDVVMPGMSGVELARTTRLRMPDLPILLASGYSEEILKGAGAEFELVRKPDDAKTLALALGHALERAPAAA